MSGPRANGGETPVATDYADDNALASAPVYSSASQQQERFKFGDNWRRFLSVLDDERMAEARASLIKMLGTDDLQGMRFLDAGSGSGLFSLAAVQLGADEVRSFDFDPASVGCAAELKRVYAPDSNWLIERGDALDTDYLASLGTFDVVYSWGVLHHTGDMYRALDNVAGLVARGGRLYISIYNDQGRRSHHWRSVKYRYNRLPRFLQPAYVVLVMAPWELRSAIGATIRLRPSTYIRSWTDYKRERGMSRWHDLVDWVGGYPFEVAKPEEILDFFVERGFSLHRLVSRQGLGCNEFLFLRQS